MTEPGSAQPVAIVAGAGELPRLIAESLERRGRPCRIMALRGFADPPLARRADAVVGLLDIGRALALLDAWQPSCVTLAGALNRPSASAVMDAAQAFRSRDEIRDLVSRGDDNLLRGVIGLLGERGHRVLGVRDLAPELLAGEGAFGRHAPEPEAQAEIALGFRLLDDLSAYDMGQAAIVAGARILAIEGPEGTDRMLGRVGRPGLLARLVGMRRGPRSGTLVKGPKRGQDLRVDVPAIGPRTIRNAARSGLAGIAIASGATLILERDLTIGLADRLGLFVTGWPIEAEAPEPAA